MKNTLSRETENNNNATSSLAGKLWGVIILSIMMGGVYASASQRQSVDPETKLKSWFVKKDAFDLEISQRLPDQTRAFFLSRGFDSAASDYIAKQCVFRTVLKNTSTNSKPVVITIDIGAWKTRSNNIEGGLRLREYWNTEFKKRFNPPAAAALALSWAIFPTQNRMMPGDYNWGMTSYGLAPGVKFNLTVIWVVDKQEFREKIVNIECAPDKPSL